MREEVPILGYLNFHGMTVAALSTPIIYIPTSMSQVFLVTFLNEDKKFIITEF